MNIRQLLEWRKQCYFCNRDLEAFPEIYGLFGDYSFKEGMFRIRSSSVQCQIDMESGELFFLNQAGKTLKDIFLKSMPMMLEIKCVQCSDQKYSYKGEIKNAGDGYVQVNALYETIVIEDIKMTQVYMGVRDAQGTYLRKRGKSVSHKPMPLIDLNKVSPDKLKDKLKTYLIFS